MESMSIPTTYSRLTPRACFRALERIFESESEFVAHRNVCVPVVLACMVLGDDLMQASHPSNATSEYESSYKTLSAASLE